MKKNTLREEAEKVLEEDRKGWRKAAAEKGQVANMETLRSHQTEMHGGDTPEHVAATLAKGSAVGNRELTNERLRRAKSSVEDLCAEVDQSLDSMESVLLKFNRATDGLVTDLRARRLAFSQEARETLKGLKDVADFMVNFEKSGGLESMCHLLDVATKLHGLFGEGALSRLAEAMLIGIERSEHDH